MHDEFLEALLEWPLHDWRTTAISNVKVDVEYKFHAACSIHDQALFPGWLCRLFIIDSPFKTTILAMCHSAHHSSSFQGSQDGMRCFPGHVCDLACRVWA